MPSQRTSLIHVSATSWGPQSQRTVRPRAAFLPNRPKAWRTLWWIGCSAAQRASRFATCQPRSLSVSGRLPRQIASRHSAVPRHRVEQLASLHAQDQLCLPTGRFSTQAGRSRREEPPRLCRRRLACLMACLAPLMVANSCPPKPEFELSVILSAQKLHSATIR